MTLNRKTTSPARIILETFRLFELLSTMSAVPEEDRVYFYFFIGYHEAGL